MTLITAQTWGYFYIWCLHAPLGNPEKPRAMAWHYAGWCLDLEARMETHEAGRGAKLTAAVIERKIPYTLFAWPAPLATEKRVKAAKKTALYCPRCAELHGYTPREIPISTQLELDLEDFPTVEIAQRMDFYELSHIQRWRLTATAPAPALADNWDDGLL